MKNKIKPILGGACIAMALLADFAAEAQTTRFRLPLSSNTAVHYYYDHGGRTDWKCGGETYSGHRGTDFSGGPRGRAIFAGANGTLGQRINGFGDGYPGSPDGGGAGNYIRLDHGGGFTSWYMHMNINTPINVPIGSFISCGTQIGGVGTSGSSSGLHLHFEPRMNGVGDDPYSGACGGPLSYWVNQNNGNPTTQCQNAPPSCDINLTQGAIRAKYESFGGCGSFLGAPTTGELTTPNGVGKYNHFANNGSIYWTAATGAWEVHGLIRDKWAALGWETSALGFPISDERSTPAGGGKYNVFQNGSIYWTSGTGAHNVQGLIRDKWAQLGWEAGFLGFPTTDESPAANGGRYNHFQGGSIYWSSATGAFSVRGAIKDKWASLGWENSCLGYPTSDEYDYNGGKRSDFQGGNITWTAAGGAVSSCGTTLADVTVDNSAAGFTVVGSWSTGTSATDKFGTNYRYHSTAAVSEPAQWQTSLTSGGNYNVSAWWAAGSNRSAAAPYTVYHATGSTTINKSQQGNGGSWQSLGIFNLNSGNNQVRLSCWTTTGFIVLADAVRWQQQ